jgi:hypothetical protein
MDRELLKPLPAEVRTTTLLARLDTRPSTFDAKSNEVDVVMGTGVAVVRASWWEDPYIEELSMEPGHVRLDRMNSGRMPLLDSHRRGSLEDQKGVVLNGTLAAGALHARLKFSRRDSVQPLVRDVADGIVGNLSLGYRVHAYQEMTLPTDSMRRLRAVDWEPMECSLVTVPADPTSEIRLEANLDERADEGALVGRAADAWTTCKIQGQPAPKPPMDPKRIDPASSESTTAPIAGTTAQGGGTATLTPAPAGEGEAERATKAERARVLEIQRLETQFKLGAPWAQRMTEGSLSIAQVQAEALTALAGRSGEGATQSHVQVVSEGRDRLRSGLQAALEFRMGVVPTCQPAGQPFLSMRLTRMAEEQFNILGIPVRDLSHNEFANLALKGKTGTDKELGRGLMSTSDFAQLLSNVQNKAMRKRYDSSPNTWMQFSRRAETPDFKPMRRIQLSGGTGLKRVNEHGEFEHGAISDQAETYSLNTEGIIYGFTRRAFLNDDLAELTRITEMMGRRAADRRSDLVWSLVTANGNLADGVAWFATAHGNLHAAGAGGVLSLTSLADMLAAMRVQKDADGNILNIRPAHLRVPAILEVTARQLTTQITPAQASNVNVFQGWFETVMAEPRLDANSATAWYAFGSPDQNDVIEYAELSGQSGPQVMIRNGFDVDGIEYRIHDDFGAAPMEYVTAYKSPGA